MFRYIHTKLDSWDGLDRCGRLSGLMEQTRLVTYSVLYVAASSI